MRLNVSKNSAEERLLDSLNEGYKLSDSIFNDYSAKVDSSTFEANADIENYHVKFNEWIGKVCEELIEIFPTQFESNYFRQRYSPNAVDYSNINNKVGLLVYQRFPTYISRVHEISNIHLNRYSDLPIQTRLFIEDIDSFIKVRDVNPSMVSKFLTSGRIELPEDEVQLGLESILNVPFHKKDWGGETNDLYTANLIINDARRSSAFLLKGNGLRKKMMEIKDCGKNGDQIVRLFESPAQLYIVQFVGNISEAIIKDIEGKINEKRSQGKECWYCIITGQDTARLARAYGKA